MSLLTEDEGEEGGGEEVVKRRNMEGVNRSRREGGRRQREAKVVGDEKEARKEVTRGGVWGMRRG